MMRVLCWDWSGVGRGVTGGGHLSNNVAIDVLACDGSPSSAVNIAQQIAAKVPT